MKDVFINSKLDEATKYWMGIFVIVNILFFVGFLTDPSLTSYGLIYVVLGFFNFSFIVAALVSNNRKAGIVVYGNSNTKFKFLRDVVIGLAVGLIFVSGYLGFSIIMQPAPFALIKTTNITSTLIMLLVIGLFGVEAEEMFRASALIPSILKFTGMENKTAGILSGLILFSLISIFFLTQILGILAIVITIGILAIGFGITLFAKVKSTSASSTILTHLIAILFAATIFMMLHVYAYGNGSYTTNVGDFVSVFSFAVVADSVNWVLQSTIASRMTHSINNIFVGTAILGVSIYLGLAIILIYILILYVSAFGFNKSIMAYDRRDVAIG